MSVELRPLGVNCNLTCRYCYQHPQRGAGNMTGQYDMKTMQAAVEKEGGGPFTLFGGEPLLVNENDLETLWAWGKEKYGSNSLQTNGTLINDNHIRMFRQYNVHVGISIDGPGELNDLRWVGSLDRTRSATAKTEKAIKQLCAERIPPSLIITLHRNNATTEKLPVLHDWFRSLDKIGVTEARLHILEVEQPMIQDNYALSSQENIDALLSFAQLEPELAKLRFDVFRDIRNLLLCKDETATCVWMACDPYTTAAVRGVEGMGQRSNCGRLNKDGIDFVKAERPGYERYLALYHTPQEYGGCKDCRFFLVCKGECPGTAIDGDWRNRTQDCELWKTLFAHVEAELIKQGGTAVSTHPNRRYLEQEMLTAWMRGSNPSMQVTIEMMHQAAAQEKKSNPAA